MHRLASDPNRHILDQLIRLSGPRLRWVSLTNLCRAVQDSMPDQDADVVVSIVSDYLFDLEARMAVERQRRPEEPDLVRPTTMAVEALLEDEIHPADD